MNQKVFKTLEYTKIRTILGLTKPLLPGEKGFARNWHHLTAFLLCKKH